MTSDWALCGRWISQGVCDVDTRRLGSEASPTNGFVWMNTRIPGRRRARRPRTSSSSSSSQVFGVENVRLLTPEFAVEDIYGGCRFIDFALRTVDERVAFEIDGLTWHVPDAERIADYEDQLLRQNSLVHQGWRVFRWTDRQIADDPEQVKEQLALFLERIPGLLAFDDFLPKQHGEVIELKPHQEEALEALDRLRAEGNTIALVTHAQGAGKTVTAITDARRLGGRTLFVAHTHELVHQAQKQFRKLWPEVTTGLFFGDDQGHRDRQPRRDGAQPDAST